MEYTIPSAAGGQLPSKNLDVGGSYVPGVFLTAIFNFLDGRAVYLQCIYFKKNQVESAYVALANKHNSTKIKDRKEGGLSLTYDQSPPVIQSSSFSKAAPQYRSSFVETTLLFDFPRTENTMKYQVQQGPYSGIDTLPVQMPFSLNCTKLSFQWLFRFVFGYLCLLCMNPNPMLLETGASDEAPAGLLPSATGAGRGKGRV